ncbi:MAG: YidC/Oxa1 family membrane protein insertase [Parcubacteria group bacterium]|jgi:YidC/Oxa1 family membrane protein insertase
MFQIFYPTIYQPLYNTLVFLYNNFAFHDFGIAIIIITLILKIILMPLSKKQIESQKKLQELQPKIKEIQNKHKDNKEKQSQELMKFYKENKANPFGGCLPMIVQLVFLIAIYQVFFRISSNNLNIQGEVLYSFVANPGQINNMFIGIIDLAKSSIPLAILAAAAQFYQTKMLMAKQKNNNDNKSKDSKNPDFAQIMNKQMLYLGPLLTLFIGIKFPAGLALYWLISTLFAIGQQMYMEDKFESLKKYIPEKKITKA